MLNSNSSVVPKQYILVYNKNFLNLLSIIPDVIDESTPASTTKIPSSDICDAPNGGENSSSMLLPNDTNIPCINENISSIKTKFLLHSASYTVAQKDFLMCVF